MTMSELYHLRYTPAGYLLPSEVREKDAVQSDGGSTRKTELLLQKGIFLVDENAENFISNRQQKALSL